MSTFGYSFILCIDYENDKLGHYMQIQLSFKRQTDVPLARNASTVIFVSHKNCNIFTTLLISTWDHIPLALTHFPEIVEISVINYHPECSEGQELAQSAVTFLAHLIHYHLGLQNLRISKEIKITNLDKFYVETVSIHTFIEY